MKLQCLTPQIAGPKGPAALQQTFCVDEADTVRLVSGADDVFVRDRPATFHGTKVALKGGLLYFGRNAITGTVTKLESFDPAHSPVTLERASVDAAAGVSGRMIPGAVVGGELLEKVQPEYPLDAKTKHQTGTVLLHAVISRQGTVQELFPIARPSDSLAGAAMAAVSQWRYRPYLLNGTPTRGGDHADGELQLELSRS